MWCLERFLKFLNYNAYIMCAVKVGRLLQHFEKYYCNLFSEHQFLLLCPVCLQSPDEKPCQGHSLRQVQISLKDKHILKELHESQNQLIELF